jgi:hypothetical protein
MSLHRFLRFEGEDFMMVDVLIGLEPKFDKMVEAAVFDSTPRGPVRLVRKEDLIILKSTRNSLIDQADIAALQNDSDRTKSLRGERPVGLRPEDGLAAQNPPISASPARHRPLAQKPKKVPRRRPKK